MTATLAVLEYHLASYRRIWRSSLLSSFVLPLLTMLGFGVGVGAYVRGGVEGVPYLDWMVPGLIASTAMDADTLANQMYMSRLYGTRDINPRASQRLFTNFLFIS